MIKKILFLVGIFIYINTFSNNLTLQNGTVNGNLISFEISWNNSWNLSNEGGNHDAVWIFVKGKTSQGNWKHVDILSNTGNHNSSIDIIIETVEDGKGVFVYGNSHGEYSISSASISITAFNLSDYNELRVFGIEMVFIPEGNFYIGDGASISSIAGQDSNPFLITSEYEIQGSNLQIINPNSVFEPQPLPQLIPESFPKGFTNFYVMKYEISQFQYVDFLNTLSYTQQLNRTASPPSSSIGTYVMVNPIQPDSLFRNGIVIVSQGVDDEIPAKYGVNGNNNIITNDETDGLYRAANFLSWADLAAYLDWAGLRPLTELEFEKVCRGGNIEPVSGEFAWGTNEISNANNPLNDGTLFEVVSDIITPGSGLANHGTNVALEGWGLRGVLRTGFAANEGSSRLESGAGFYGAMEMSGNVWEQTVMVADEGVNYIGNPGDGLLDENGNANQPSWCNNSTASGVLLKGGGWGSTISGVGSWRDPAISDRFYSHLKPTLRRNSTGGRGAR